MNRRDVPGGANTGEVIPTHFRWKGTFAQGSQARGRFPGTCSMGVDRMPTRGIQ